MRFTGSPFRLELRGICLYTLWSHEHPGAGDDKSLRCAGSRASVLGAGGSPRVIIVPQGSGAVISSQHARSWSVIVTLGVLSV